MQLISEAYHLLRKIGGMDNDELHTTFLKWNEGKLHSYLIEITADIFSQKDALTSDYLIDRIVDSAHQKGTGGWTSEDAINLQVSIPVIDLAVSMRHLSGYKEEREAAKQMLKDIEVKFSYDRNQLIGWLEDSLYFSMITTFVQGMDLLHVASEKYNYNLKLDDVARIWRGGCIIRASLLEDIRIIFSAHQNLPNLFFK